MKTFSGYSLLPHNTFGIEAECKDFIEYETAEELAGILPRLAATRFLHIGAGSNLLFTRDFDGTVLHSAIKGREVLSRNPSDGSVLLRVGAGECWDELVEWCVGQGFYGAENLSLIPGEAGAAAVQNIGAYGTELEQLVHTVEAVDVATGQPASFTRQQCQYAYRSSIFKAQAKGRYVVTHVTLRLSTRFAPDLSYGALQRELAARGWNSGISPQQLRQMIVEVRREKLPDPKQTGSAGSFFMNPVVDEATFRKLQAQYPAIPHYPQAGGVKIPAGWMIEQCGWKGRAMGRAGVYAKQALVLVNLGGATGAEVVALSEAVRADVKRKFGVEIRPEVNFI